MCELLLMVCRLLLLPLVMTSSTINCPSFSRPCSFTMCCSWGSTAAMPAQQETPCVGTTLLQHGGHFCPSSRLAFSQLAHQDTL
ncbi:hypothetical protein COO60DRAFT_1513401 [Scenedesmus sp. NREL 46B-D3]|nr:hypothetical protein COO60DRAFT_1513401 [Scenedesmus sp. NREL 46B-D3]